MQEEIIINPLTSPGEVVSVFTSPYLSAGAPALGEAKGLNNVFPASSEAYKEPEKKEPEPENMDDPLPLSRENPDSQ